MAHKKAGGSSRNGRDSQSKRLGVKRFAGLYKVIYILPDVISVVVAAHIWRSILHPTMGIGRQLAECARATSTRPGGRRP